MLYMRHIRAARLCSHGARAWFAENNLSWSDFLANGIHADRVRGLNDALAQRVIAAAEQEAAR